MLRVIEKKGDVHYRLNRGAGKGEYPQAIEEARRAACAVEGCSSDRMVVSKPAKGQKIYRQVFRLAACCSACHKAKRDNCHLWPADTFEFNVSLRVVTQLGWLEPAVLRGHPDPAAPGEARRRS